MKPALLVIDVQKAFFGLDPVMTQSLNSALRYINAGIKLFREKQLPVICIQHMNEDNNLVPGQEGFDTPESMRILPSDVHIHKTYGNAFNKTPLTETLQDLGVDTVIITGFCAEHCITSTYRGAMDVDITPVILRGSIASDSLENIKFVENIHDSVSFGALQKFLE
jgi:nicotinamidase-related amidase